MHKKYLKRISLQKSEDEVIKILQNSKKSRILNSLYWMSKYSKATLTFKKIQKAKILKGELIHSKAHQFTKNVSYEELDLAMTTNYSKYKLKSKQQLPKLSKEGVYSSKWLDIIEGILS